MLGLFNDLTDDEQLAKLKEILPRAEEKARHSREVMATKGYADFVEYIKTVTNQTLPAYGLNTQSGVKDQLIEQCYINYGMQQAASFFQASIEDEKTLKTAIRELEAGPDEEIGDHV